MDIGTFRSRAAIFETSSCRAAISNANVSRWRQLCRGAPGHSAQFDAQLCHGRAQFYRRVTTAAGHPLVYVRNQKAASQVLTYELARIFDAAGPRQEGVLLQPLAPANESTFLFSFVREPLDAALDAYLELRNLAPVRSLEYRTTMARAMGGDSAGGAFATTLQPCRNASDATRQFASFLQAVRRGDALGGDAYHFFPQSLKLDHVEWGATAAATGSGRTRGYDALGRVERFEADVMDMRTVLGLPRANLSAVLQSRRHSHRHEACARIDRSDAALRRSFCELFAVDYSCLRTYYPSSPCVGASSLPDRSDAVVPHFSLDSGLL